MKCLEKCEFLNFGKGSFTCGYYDIGLVVNVAETEISPHRCKKCMDEAIVGNNTVDEASKKAKFRLGLIGDSFYSFKDDFESELTEIYRILKEMEEKSQND